MYGTEAIKRQRCSALTKVGKPCRAWAVWDDPRQLCVNHAGHHHIGPLSFPSQWDRPRANYTPCTCVAYAWPHRPGGVLCRWPDPPLYQRTTPEGTHAAPRRRRTKWDIAFRAWKAERRQAQQALCERKG